MGIQRMDHVGITVDDLAAAIRFFVELGLELVGEAAVEGAWVDRVIGLEGVRSDIAMLETPDGAVRIELSKFHSPAPDRLGPRVDPVTVPGLTHVSFAVEGLDDVLGRLRSLGGALVGEVERYGDSYRLCYLRGPAGIIVELAEALR